MNNTYSPDQMQKTGDLKADLLLRQNKLDKMAKFMQITSNNPILKQPEIAKLLELSSSTVQRYRRKINMLSAYNIPLSSKTNHTKKQKTPNKNLNDVMLTSNDLKMTSNDIKTTSKEPVKNKKNKLKGGAIEINE